MSTNSEKNALFIFSIVLNNIGILACYFFICLNYLNIPISFFADQFTYLNFFPLFIFIYGSFLFSGLYLNLIYDLKKNSNSQLLENLKHTSYLLVIIYYLLSLIKSIIFSLIQSINSEELYFAMVPTLGKLDIGIHTPLWFLLPLIFAKRLKKKELINILILYILSNLVCFTFYNLKIFVAFLLGGSAFLITERYGFLLTQKMRSIPEKLRFIITIPVGILGFFCLIPYLLVF